MCRNKKGTGELAFAQRSLVPQGSFDACMGLGKGLGQLAYDKGTPSECFDDEQRILTKICLNNIIYLA
jgi:hypothetical protein